MLKKAELTDPASCMSRARDDEMVFVLLGRDAAAPAAIYAWVAERIRLGKNKRGDAQIVEATACAMEIERAHGDAHLVRPQPQHKTRVEATLAPTVPVFERGVGIEPSPWLPHPSAPGWVWNTATNEVVSEADFKLKHHAAWCAREMERAAEFGR